MYLLLLYHVQSVRNQFFCEEQNPVFYISKFLHGFFQIDRIVLFERFLPLTVILSNRSEVVEG